MRTEQTIGPCTEKAARRLQKEFEAMGAVVTLKQEGKYYWLDVDTTNASFRIGR